MDTEITLQVLIAAMNENDFSLIKIRYNREKAQTGDCLRLLLYQRLLFIWRVWYTRFAKQSDRLII